MGCGPAVPPPATALVVPEAAPLGPLVDLVPAGAELIVVGAPATLYRTPALLGALDTLLPPEQARALEIRVGVLAPEVSEGVYADYGEGGFLILLRAPFAARDIVEAAGMRMNSVEVSVDGSGSRRTGFVGLERRDFVALADDVVAIGGGHGAPMAATIHRARNASWPEGASGAFEGTELAALRETHGGAPLALYVPQRLDLPEGLGLSLLLARQTSMAASITPADDALVTEVELRGEFPPGADGNFETWVQSIARTDLGHALGIQAGLPTLALRVRDVGVAFTLDVPAEIFARGLRLLFVAELREIFGDP